MFQESNHMEKQTNTEHGESGGRANHVIGEGRARWTGLWEAFFPKGRKAFILQYYTQVWDLDHSITQWLSNSLGVVAGEGGRQQHYREDGTAAGGVLFGAHPMRYWPSGGSGKYMNPSAGLPTPPNIVFRKPLPVFAMKLEVAVFLAVGRCGKPCRWVCRLPGPPGGWRCVGWVLKRPFTTSSSAIFPITLLLPPPVP